MSDQPFDPSQLSLPIAPGNSGRFRGEFSVSQLVTEWQLQKNLTGNTQPIVLFDLGWWRQTHVQLQNSLAALPAETVTISRIAPEVDLATLTPVWETPAFLSSANPLPVWESAKPLSLPQPPALIFLAAEATPEPKPQIHISPVKQIIEIPHYDIIYAPGRVEPPHSQGPIIIGRPWWQPNWLELSSHMLISVSVALLLLFAGPVVILESQSLVTRAFNSIQKKPVAMVMESPAPEATPEINSNEDVFSIKIPSLDIDSLVIPNVDVNDKNAYMAALKQGVAHAQGSGFPDQLERNKTIYLFAHSTDEPWDILRYNAKFFALKDAQPGQEITLRFWGKDYTYVIQDKKIIEPDDTSYLEPQLDHEQLILQTCYPPGTVNKRLLIIAVPKT